MFFIYFVSAGNSLLRKFEKQNNYCKIRLIFKIIIFWQMCHISNLTNLICLILLRASWRDDGVEITNVGCALDSLCCNGQQMAGRNSSLAICTCICTPFVDSHSSSTNPRIPPVASVTSRRIATYRSTPLRNPFRLYSYWRRAFSLALEPAFAPERSCNEWPRLYILTILTTTLIYSLIFAYSLLIKMLACLLKIINERYIHIYVHIHNT